MQTHNWDYEGMWVLKVKVISLQYIFQVLYVLCFTEPRYQVSVYRTIGPLVLLNLHDFRENSELICCCLQQDERGFTFGYISLNIHEIWLCLFRGEHSRYIRAKMTSFVNSHDWHVVLVCLIKKMDHIPFELSHFTSYIPVPGTYQTDFASCTSLKRCQHYETWLLVVCQCKGI